jgi:hypothetical protein
MSVNACTDIYGKFYCQGRKGMRWYYELSVWGKAQGICVHTKNDSKWSAKCFGYKWKLNHIEH